jgi:hypothetical protein
MKTAVIGVLSVCSSVVTVAANRYVCDTYAYDEVEDIIADLDYEQRYQQKDIDDFNEQLDDLKALSEGNNTCGDDTLHNSDQGDYSIILGGCENDLNSGSDYSTIGGGQQNWGYVDAKLVAIAGGLHNIATGDWTSITGGVKNKAYSNYATVSGGYLGKSSSKFATVTGGSKNTVSGRYGIGMGMKVKVTGDNSIGMGFDSGIDCNVRGDNTFGVCAQSFILSGEYGEFDLLSELTSRRQLTTIGKEIQDLEKENMQLEKSLRAQILALLDTGRIGKEAGAAIAALLPSTPN